MESTTIRKSTDYALYSAMVDAKASKEREGILLYLEDFISDYRNKALSKQVAEYENRLYAALFKPLGSLFQCCGTHTWSTIRILLKHECDMVVSAFLHDIKDLDLDQATSDKAVHNLKEYAMKLVERKAREEAGIVLIRMKDRFANVLIHDKSYVSRVWTAKEDIRAITKEAHTESLKLLSAMAALRFDERNDTIENVLLSTLLDESIGVSIDPLDSSTWEEVPSDKTLFTPVECRTLWRQFKQETEFRIVEANIIQEAYNRRGNNWLPPLWVILAMVVLGFNEFMLLLRNPLYMLVLIVVFILGIAIWVQKNVHKCILSGHTFVSTRYFRTILNSNSMRCLAAEGHGNSDATPSHQLASSSFKNQLNESDSMLSSIQNLS